MNESADEAIERLQRLASAKNYQEVITEVRPRLAALDVRFHILHAQCGLLQGEIYTALQYLVRFSNPHGGNSYYCYVMAVAASLVSAAAAELRERQSRRALELDARREHLEFYMNLALSVGARTHPAIRQALGRLSPGDFRAAADDRSLVPAAFDHRETQATRLELTAAPAARVYYEARSDETAMVDKPGHIVTSKLSFFAVDNATLYLTPGMEGLIQREDGSFVGEGAVGHLNPRNGDLARRFGDRIYLNYEAIERAYGPRRELDGEFIVPFRLAGEYYFHFLFETLTGLLRAKTQRPGVRSILADYDEFFSRMRRPVHQEMIAALDLPEGSILTPKRGVYRVRRLLTPTYRGYGDLGLAERFAEAPASKDDVRVLYVTRRGAATRQLRNEAEVCDALRARFGEVDVVELERLSFAEQRRLFAERRIVCGPHGGGLANLLFCRPGATVLEIHTLGSIPCFWHVSFLKGLRYFAYVPSAGDRDDAFHVDLVKFKQWLNAIDVEAVTGAVRRETGRE